MPEKRISLRFTQGSSDKVYNASIEQVAGGFAVNFAYGRFGSTLNTGTKTQQPVSEVEAEKIFNKLVQEKTGKGYREVEGTAVNYVAPAAATKVARSDIGCMLLTAVDEETGGELIVNDGYVAQEKFDGKRIILVGDTDGIFAFNRKSIQCPIGEPIVEAGTKLRNKYGRFIIDGESIGERYASFDCLQFAGEDVREQTLDGRFTNLAYLLRSSTAASPIFKARTAHTLLTKQELLEELLARRAEGIVFKNAHRPYREGYQKDQFKCKFYSTATVIVVSPNKQRSVKMAVLQDGTPVEVGNVTIPPNKEIPQAGHFIEVRYLYAYRNGSLYQPTYIRERTDEVGWDDCSIEQLKYKAEVED